MVNQDDQLLIDRLRSGDVAAFNVIVDKYYKLLCWEAHLSLYDKQVIPDVVQDLLINIWENEELLRLKNAGSLKQFLVVAVRRRAIDANRKFKVDQSRLVDIAAQQESDLDIEYEGFLEKEFVEKLDKVNKMLDKLPGRRGDVLKLLYFKRMTIREIAERLGLSYDAIRKDKERGIEDLRERMLTRR